MKTLFKNKEIFKKLNFNFFFIISLLIAISSTIFWSIPNDVYWSLNAGKDQLFSKNFMNVDSWTFTANGDYWPNHEWLWEVFTFISYKMSFNSLFILNVATILIFVGTIWVSIRSDLSKWKFKRLLKDPLFITVVLLLSFYFSGLALQRALIVSFLLFSLFIVYSKKNKPIVLCFLMLLWANIHASFFLGLLIVGFVIVFNSLFNIINRNKLIEGNQKLLKVFPILIVVTFIQPLGYKLWLYVFETLGKVNVGIKEWLPIYFFPAVFAIFAVIFFSVVITVLTFLKFKKLNLIIFESLLLIPFMILPFMAVRNVAYLFIVYLMFLSKVFYSISIMKRNYLSKIFPSIKIKEFLKKPLKVIYTSSVSVIIIVLMIVGSSVSNTIFNRVIVNPEMKNLFINECDGRVMNSYNIGAELEWKWPENKTFIDSRFDPFDSDIVQTISPIPDIKYEGILKAKEKYSIKCAFIETTNLSNDWLKKNSIYRSNSYALISINSYLDYVSG